MTDSLKKLSLTSITRLKPKLALKKQELHWFLIFSDKAAQFRGYLGTELFETITKNKQPEFAIIIHFDTYENSVFWENSMERKAQMELSKTFFDEVEPTLWPAGLEYWYETKEINNPMPPAKWKMLIIMIVIIFTLLNSLIPLLRELFKPLKWHPMVNSLLSVVIMVILMTYLVMPFTTKVLSRWLFKTKKGGVPEL